MWAAIKSDLKEFVSTAAEETNAVTTKVVSKTSDSISGSGSKAKQEDQDNPKAGGWAGAALAPLSNASRGFSMEGVGASVKGFSSMIGGVVAPHPRADRSSAAVGEGYKNSPLLASEDEEEELGWDDEEDDLDVDDDEEEGDTPLADVVLETQTSKQEVATQHDDTNEILSALQSKLSAVEKERNELQIEHRKQTALLVELRSKVEELERGNDVHGEGVAEADTDDSEMQALRDEIASLKLQLEQSSSTHVQVKDTENDEENEAILKQYQRQIQELTSELECLQQKCHSSDTELQRAKEQSSQDEREFNTIIDEQKKQLEAAHSKTSKLEQSLVDMETSYARALQELQDSKSKIVELEGENQRLAEEVAAQASNFASTFEEEVIKSKREMFDTPMATPAVPTRGVVNEEKLEDDSGGEISSGEKIMADDSFVTAGDVLSPKVKNAGEADAEEDDWGDGDWGDDED